MYPLFRSVLLVPAATGLVLASADRAAAQAAPSTDPDRLARQVERDWDTGHYVEALEAAEALLATNPGESRVRRIAQLTGEVYHTEELTSDGSLPAISATGRYASFATEDEGMVTRIVDRRNGGRLVVELEGTHQLSFAPDENAAAFLAEDRVTVVALPDGTVTSFAAPPGTVELTLTGGSGLLAVAGTEERREIYRYGSGAGAPVTGAGTDGWLPLTVTAAPRRTRETSTLSERSCSPAAIACGSW